jgi:hypothetical protein
VATLTGSGTFFMQPLSEGAFASWLVPYLPRSSSRPDALASRRDG